MKTHAYQLLFSVALVTLAWGSGANAATTVIDFDGVAPDLLFPDESFVLSGYKLTPLDAFAQIDVAAAVVVPPSGNSTQFYFQTGQGGLGIEREDGGVFGLGSFSAAFVPLTPAINQTTVLLAFGVHPDDSFDVAAFNFASSVGGSYPFASYVAPNVLSNLKSLQFFACSNDTSGLCGDALRGNGQFALDDIGLTTAVPEPAVSSLLLLGLSALGCLKARRGGR